MSIKNLTLQSERHNIERHVCIQILKALNSTSPLYISFKGHFLGKLNEYELHSTKWIRRIKKR